MTSIIIIGGGVAGLAAGCYGQMNGFRTRILEQHARAGGVCTGWRRGEYTFDGCIHWLIGSSPASPYYRVWEELGATCDWQIVHNDELMRVQAPDGRALVVHADIDVFEEHLLDLAPDDTDVVREITRVLRLFAKEVLPLQGPRELAGSAMKSWPKSVVLKELLKYAPLTIEQFASRFTSSIVREALPRLFDNPGFSMAPLLTTLAAYQAGDGGFPVGGSGAFSRAIARRYIDLGGQIDHRCRVKKILVDDGQVLGVRLDDDTELLADIVISAADGRSTIFDMLDGRYGSSFVKRYYESRHLFPPRVQVSLGVAMDFSGEPHDVTVPIPDAPLHIAGVAHDALRVRHFCFDPTMAPEGKSAVTVSFVSDYSAWKSLSNDRARYEDEKKRAVEGVLGVLENRWPDVSSAVEVSDVATPVTWERYTSNWRGSYEGWILDAEAMQFVAAGRGLPRTLAGLKSFYMVGQWVEPGGGLGVVALSGRQIIQLICHELKMPFVADGG